MSTAAFWIAVAIVAVQFVSLMVLLLREWPRFVKLPADEVSARAEALARDRRLRGEPDDDLRNWPDAEEFLRADYRHRFLWNCGRSPGLLASWFWRRIYRPENRPLPASLHPPVIHSAPKQTARRRRVSLTERKQ